MMKVRWCRSVREKIIAVVAVVPCRCWFGDCASFSCKADQISQLHPLNREKYLPPFVYYTQYVNKMSRTQFNLNKGPCEPGILQLNVPTF